MANPAFVATFFHQFRICFCPNWRNLSSMVQMIGAVRQSVPRVECHKELWMFSRQFPNILIGQWYSQSSLNAGRYWSFIRWIYPPSHTLVAGTWCVCAVTHNAGTGICEAVIKRGYCINSCSRNPLILSSFLKLEDGVGANNFNVDEVRLWNTTTKLSAEI
jgi:hypothetical protein